MATKIVTVPKIEELVRITSRTGKLYLILKDRKKHNIRDIRKTLTGTYKGAIFSVVYRLGRLLRAHMGLQIEIVDRFDKAGYIKLAPFVPVKASKRRKVAA
jgi:hypothetical protein